MHPEPPSSTSRVKARRLPAAVAGRLSQREGLHARENFVPAEIACQNGGHLESASWRLEARRRRAAARRPGAGQLLALSRSSGPTLDLDGLSASQPGGGLRPVKPIRPKT